MTCSCFKLRKCCCDFCGCRIKLCVSFLSIIFTLMALISAGLLVYGLHTGHKHEGDLIYAGIQSITLTICVLGYLLACCFRKKAGRAIFYYAFTLRYFALLLFPLYLFFKADTNFAYFLVVKNFEDHYIREQESQVPVPAVLGYTRQQSERIQFWFAIGSFAFTLIIDGWFLCNIGSWYKSKANRGSSSSSSSS